MVREFDITCYNPTPVLINKQLGKNEVNSWAHTVTWVKRAYWIVYCLFCEWKWNRWAACVMLMGFLNLFRQTNSNSWVWTICDWGAWLYSIQLWHVLIPFMYAHRYTGLSGTRVDADVNTASWFGLRGCIPNQQVLFWAASLLVLIPHRLS